MATRFELTEHPSDQIAGDGPEVFSAAAEPSPARPLLVPIAPSDPAYARAKRATDIILSLFALVALAPLFLLIALGIRITSGREVIYRQTRLGLGGHPFTLYKFRTMIPNAEAKKKQLLTLNETDGPIFKIRRDPRITNLGARLRHSSLDELPQLVNVLKGDMSLVGPRPLLTNEVEYGDWRQIHRISVKPGITGLWQVSGRSELDFEDWIALDHEYIAKRSYWFDLKMLLMTIPAVLSGRGAY